jgi:hypothetical protein
MTHQMLSFPVFQKVLQLPDSGLMTLGESCVGAAAAVPKVINHEDGNCKIC